MDAVYPQLEVIFQCIMGNPWYLQVVRHMIGGDAGMAITVQNLGSLGVATVLSLLPASAAARSNVNRYMVSCLLQFLLEKKLHHLQVALLLKAA